MVWLCDALLLLQGASWTSDKEDVREGVITYKLAAHAADLAKGHPAAQFRIMLCRRHDLNLDGKISLTLVGPR